MQKNNLTWLKSIVLLIIINCLFSCEKNKVLPFDAFACTLEFQDTSAVHPNANDYQSLLENNQRNGLGGAVLLIKDKDGLWMGESGKADIASDINTKACNTFFIGSVSKVFTSAATYRLVERGIISLDDPISDWLDKSIVDNVRNADQAQIKHLLSHKSGIVDFYTVAFELDRINKLSNDFTPERVLEYIYGKSPTNEVGEIYHYSNTNFLLLSLVLEKASGLTLEQIYAQEIFTPLDLNSGYYSESQPIPDEAIKGYFDIYENDQYIESEFLYNDELGIGGDGGIAMNAYDVSVFLEKLIKGDLISSASLEIMTSFFTLPSEFQTSRQIQNGVGIERFETEYGYAVGHTGSIDGFLSFAFYFPDEDMTFILLTNSAGSQKGLLALRNIFQESIEIMFN